MGGEDGHARTRWSFLFLWQLLVVKLIKYEVEFVG